MLNTKKLYMADGHAVQELLKLSTLLYKAAKYSNLDAHDTDEKEAFNWSQAAISEKVRIYLQLHSIDLLTLLPTYLYIAD